MNDTVDYVSLFQKNVGQLQVYLFDALPKNASSPAGTTRICCRTWFVAQFRVEAFAVALFTRGLPAR
ncbi:hypothetical protein JYU29_10595 [Tianweitania sp. BSSL-BM11]|uniref:Uncharacterized protein n=1 Tax=Tianweitania aestuarii TaxID=2814886 RepID=A0ABS5RVQ5_9HYPH|nr:hypothetical protein [Tianweitania aestuarii]